MGRSLLYWLIVARKQSMLSWKKKKKADDISQPLPGSCQVYTSIPWTSVWLRLALTMEYMLTGCKQKFAVGSHTRAPPFCCWQPWGYHAKNPNLAFWRWGTTKREVPATVLTETFSQGLVLWVRSSETTQPSVTQPKEFWTILNIDYFKPLTFRVVCYSAKDK